MVIPPEIGAQIVRLSHAEKWPPGTIASQLGIHHSVVTRVLATNGVPRPACARPSKLDSFIPFVQDTLQRYPRLAASRVSAMCRERGFQGSDSHFRRLVARLRPRPPAEAYLRLRMFPGEQAQADWGHFGTIQIGRAQRALLAFVLVLSYSRRIFLRFFLGGQTENFLRGHEAAFGAFGGVPRVVLYDRLKSAVLESVGNAIHFNPVLLAFSTHYHFEPRPVAKARGNEKGRVERAIGYVRESFFAALQHHGLDDLNQRAQAWCDGTAMQRPWPEDKSLTVAQAFAQEQSKLLPLPPDGFPVDERREVAIGKTPYARFDQNDYSVPHELVRRTLTVVASLTTVRVLDASTVVAEHLRSFSRHEQIEDPRHIEGLVEAKEKGRKHRGYFRLYHAVPSSEELVRRLAESGENLGSATSYLLRLLDEHGAVALHKAIQATLKRNCPANGIWKARAADLPCAVGLLIS